MNDTIDAILDRLRQSIPDSLQWLLPIARRTLEYVFGPFNGDGGRFPWYGILAGLGIAAAAFIWGTRDRHDRTLSGFLRFCFPKEIYLDKNMLVDLQIGFMNPFIQPAVNVTWRITTVLIASKITALLTLWLGPNTSPVAWTPTAVIVCAIAYSMLSDFGYFLFHWTAHVFPPLWAIHKLHHSAEALTPLTAARVHPLERAVMGPFMAFTTALLVAPIIYFYGGTTSPGTILGLSMPGSLFFLGGHILHHSHVWVYFGPIIGRVIVSPVQHQIHHSSLPQHCDRNFAEHWAIWDTLFGTLYLPRGRETLKMGLTGYTRQPHTGLISALFGPVWDSAKASLALILRLGRRYGLLQPPGALRR